MRSELFLFGLINIGVPLVLKTLQWAKPELFWTMVFALGAAGLILVANVFRLAVLDDWLRWAYATVIMLNLFTLVFVGNVAFLTSIGAWFVVIRTLVF